MSLTSVRVDVVPEVCVAIFAKQQERTLESAGVIPHHSPLRKNPKALLAHACSDAQDYSTEVQAKMMHHDHAAIEETRRRDATFSHLRRSPCTLR